MHISNGQYLVPFQSLEVKKTIRNWELGPNIHVSQPSNFTESGL